MSAPVAALHELAVVGANKVGNIDGGSIVLALKCSAALPFQPAVHVHGVELQADHIECLSLSWAIISRPCAQHDRCMYMRTVLRQNLMSKRGGCK